MRNRFPLIIALLLLPSLCHAQAVNPRPPVLHGNEATMPLVPTWQPYYSVDTHRWYVGTPAGNVLVLGAQGLQGLQGVTGATGATGANGATGPAGANGAAGAAGTGYTLGTASQTAHMNAGGTAFVTDSGLLNNGSQIGIGGVVDTGSRASINPQGASENGLSITMPSGATGHGIFVKTSTGNTAAYIDGESAYFNGDLTVQYAITASSFRSGGYLTLEVGPNLGRMRIGAMTGIPADALGIGFAPSVYGATPDTFLWRSGPNALQTGATLTAAGYKSSDGSAGITATVPLAALTTGGTQGSLTIRSGLITATVNPT